VIGRSGHRVIGSSANRDIEISETKSDVDHAIARNAKIAEIELERLTINVIGVYQW
jgi:hypothetical protein